MKIQEFGDFSVKRCWNGATVHTFSTLAEIITHWRIRKKVVDIVDMFEIFPLWFNDSINIKSTVTKGEELEKTNGSKVS